MNRRFLVFLVLVNALVSLAIAVTVVWIAEQRRPSMEELVLPSTPAPAVVPIATPTAAGAQAFSESDDSSTATPIPVSGPEPVGETEIYVVERGDSLSAIAARFGLSLNSLMGVNDLTDPDFVFVGQRLVIPVAPARVQAPAAALPQQGLQLRVEGAGDLAAESVQVVNDTNAAVDLQGWTLSRDGGPIYTFGGALLFPGSGINLYTAAGQNNSVSRYWGRDAPAWQTGSTVALRDSGGELIAQIAVPASE